MLEQRIADLQAEMAMVSPDHSLARGFLTDIRNILVGAAGNLVASGAIQILDQMLYRRSNPLKKQSRQNPRRCRASRGMPDARCDHPRSHAAPTAAS
jgi:hypothetical protein